MQLNLLIAKAASVAGNQRALAKMLNEPETHVSNWKAGSRTCPPATRAILAEIAGEDAAREALEGVMEGIDVDTPKGRLAKEALDQALASWRKR